MIQHGINASIGCEDTGMNDYGSPYYTPTTPGGDGIGQTGMLAFGGAAVTFIGAMFGLSRRNAPAQGNKFDQFPEYAKTVDRFEGMISRLAGASDTVGRVSKRFNGKDYTGIAERIANSQLKTPDGQWWTGSSLFKNVQDLFDRLERVHVKSTRGSAESRVSAEKLIEEGRNLITTAQTNMKEIVTAENTSGSTKHVIRDLKHEFKEFMNPLFEKALQIEGPKTAEQVNRGLNWRHVAIAGGAAVAVGAVIFGIGKIIERGRHRENLRRQREEIDMLHQQQIQMQQPVAPDPNAPSMYRPPSPTAFGKN
jgi:hypothetical protein